MKPSGPGPLSVGYFLITDSISLLATGLMQIFYFFKIQSWKTIFLGTYSFLLGYLIWWCIIVHNILLWSFVFLWCPLLFLFFHFWFCLGSLCFLTSLVKSVDFCWCFQITNSSFHWSFLFIYLFVYLFISYFTYFFSWSLLFPSFYALWALFSFSSFFKCKLRLFEIFIVS